MLNLKCFALGTGLVLTVGAGAILGSATGVVFADEPADQTTIAIDERNFPDDGFRKYVSQTIDKDKDGKLSQKERDEVELIDVSFTNVISLQGIQYFEKMETLSCNTTSVSEIDFSLMPSLKQLDCGYSAVNSLDLSACPQLRKLYCYYCEISQLDISHSAELRSLDISGTLIRNLDLASCPKLEEFAIYDSSLSKLDLSLLPNLASLDCRYNEFKSLDLSSTPYLRFLYCDGNPIKNLDVSNLKYLVGISCGETLISELDLSNHEYLQEVYVPEVGLSSLSLENCPNLETLVAYSNQLTDDSIDFSKLNNLHTLDIEDNDYTTLDVSGLDKLEYLYANYNEITNCNVAGCSSLLALTLDENKLTEIDLTGCKNLVQFSASMNSIESIDLSDCKALESLGISMNPIGSLDLSNNTKLVEIYAEDCGLSELNINGLKDLQLIFITVNNLTKMDISTNTKLELLACSGNKIAELKTGKNEALLGIDAMGNPFTKLDVSGCPNLLILYANGAALTSIDLRNNKSLMQLDLSGVAMDKIDIRLCPQLVDLVENFPRQIAEDGESYYYTDIEEEEFTVDFKELKDVLKAQEEEDSVDPEGLIVFGRYLGYSMKTELISADPTPTPTTAPTATPTPTETPTPTPTTAPEKEATVADFVERLYTEALGREAEESGKKYWVNEITNGRKTGGDCGIFFLTGEEFTNRKLSVEDFVETLYKTFFGRASEASGKAYWVGVLKNGGDRTAVIKGFIDSKEWCNLCADYGVRSGAPNAKAERASKKATEFATRLYTCCLGREPEEAGLAYWALALTNLDQTGCSAAKMFFTGAEFVNQKVKDDEYVRRLYTTFMDREPEASEVAYWAGEISKGTQTRESVLSFFGQSEEFSGICAKYGIKRGTI